LQSPPRAPTLPPVPTLTIKLSSSLLQLFLAEVPPVEQDSFAENALLEALDRRRNLTNQKRAVGRPAPAIEKVRKTYNLDSDVADRIAELAVSDPTKSESAVANRILRQRLFPDEQ